MKTRCRFLGSRKYPLVSLAAILALSLLGCGGGGGGTERENLAGEFGTITGVVDSSSPRASEVTVQLEGTERQTSPDADGNFEFDQVAVGEYTVAAWQDGQNLGAAVSAQVGPDRITHVGLLQLRPGGQIAGLVTTPDPENGDLQPVGGARVVARPVGEVAAPTMEEGGRSEGESEEEPPLLPPPFRVAVTDRSGSYRMVGVAPGHYVIEVTHPHFAATQKEFDVEAGQTTAADFLLQPLNPQELGTVAGTVMDQENQPLGRVRVELFPLIPQERSGMGMQGPPEERPGQPGRPSPPLGPPDLECQDPAFIPPRLGELVTYTDEQGQFNFPGVPPGEYRIVAAKRGYSVEDQEIDVKAGATTTADFTLESRLVEVNGTVYGLKEDGTQEPLAGAQVWVREFSPLMRPNQGATKPGGPEGLPWSEDQVMTTTDEQGNYTLPVTAGPTILLAEKEGYQPARQFVEVDPNHPPTVDFVLSPQPPEPPPGPEPQPRPRLNLELSLSAEEFSAGEAVEMRLRVTNQTEETVRVHTAYPGGYDFAVYGKTGELWRWSHDKAFAAMIGELVLGPGESQEFTETWNQTDNEGQPLPPGEYVAMGFLATHPPLHSLRMPFRVVATSP